MDFGTALTFLKEGRRMSRDGWNGASMWVALQEPDTYSAMGLPYLYLRTVDGALVPWQASQTDLLAEDWQHADNDGSRPSADAPEPDRAQCTIHVHVTGAVLSERDLADAIRRHTLRRGPWATGAPILSERQLYRHFRR